MKLKVGIQATAIALLLHVPSVPAQEHAKATEETKIVLRISRNFIQKLVGVDFKSDHPIGSNTAGTMVTGNARILGKLDVTLHKSDTESDFDLSVSGEALTQLSATRRPVVVHTHGVAPFNACRRIVFDGKTFSAQEIQISVTNRMYLDDIRSFRGGLIGAVTRRVARPVATRGVADGERKVEGELRAEITTAIDDATDKLVETLNEIRPIVEKGEKLLIEEGLLPMERFSLYRAATHEHLLVSVGPAGQRIPKLPHLDAKKQAPLELWIAKMPGLEGVRQQFFLAQWRELEKTVHKQLVRQHPDLAQRFDKDFRKYLDKVEVHTAGDWHVVTFAAELPSLRILELPN